MEPQTEIITARTLLGSSWKGFCYTISTFLAELGLADNNLTIDHAGMRILQMDRAISLVEEFKSESVSRFWSVNTVNGRDIFAFELLDPLKLDHRTVQYVELPMPQQGKTFPRNGFEHAELVYLSNANTEEAFESEVFQAFPQLRSIKMREIEIEGMTYRTEMPQVKPGSDEPPNPTLIFAKEEEMLAVRIHPVSIRDLRKEWKQGVSNAR